MMVKTFLKLLLGVILLAFVLILPQLLTETTAITSYAVSIISQNNFNTVLDNRLYRSGEMTNKKLRQVIKKYGIRTVVDLHYGDDDPDEDGVVTKTVVIESGASYFHVPLLGSRLPHHATVKNLIEIYDNSAVPVLIFCTSGTHRSGVATIIWLLTQENVDPKEAVKQLSPRYGYFYFERWLKAKFQGYPTIDGLIWSYYEAYKKSGITFRDWVKNEESSKI